VSAQKFNFYRVSTKIEVLSCQHKNRVFIMSAQKYIFYRVSTKIEFVSCQHKNVYCFTFREPHKVVILDNHLRIIRCFDLWSWAVTLRGEYRMRVFENRVLRDVWGHKWDDLTGEWRRLLVNSEKLYALGSSPNVIRLIKPRRKRWAEYVARMGTREVYTEC
jgi:hypothetical protein